MKKKAAKVVQETKVPEWLEEGSQFAVGRAREIADREYTPYTGNRIAGMSENEQQALNLARDTSRGQGYLDKAGAQIDAMEDFTPENLAKYQDPYREQVVESALRKEREAYGSELANLRAGAAKRGAFGGDRQALLESGLAGRHLEATGDITSRGMSDAFRFATQTWAADNQRRLAASDAYRAVGGDITRMNSQQISDLVKTGQIDRLLEQADLDFDYYQFLENRDWDVTNLQPLVQTLSAVPHSTTTTKKQYPGSSGPWGTILGVVGTAVGAYFGAPQVGGAIGSGVGGMVDADQPYDEG